MNSVDVLFYGNRTLRATLDGLSEPAWEIAEVCGVWSTRQIVAHLASFETLLAEVLASLLEPGLATPTLDSYRSRADFNDAQVDARAALSSAATLADYAAAHERVMALARSLPPTSFRRRGLLPWYGEAYDLDDFIVYTNYGHKREHGAQIARFRKRLTSNPHFV